MKFASLALMVGSIVLTTVGHFADITWLMFVGIAMLPGAVALDPNRSFLGRRKSS